MLQDACVLVVRRYSLSITHIFLGNFGSQEELVRSGKWVCYGGMPKRPKHPKNEALQDRSWVEAETDGLDFGDERLEERVRKMLGDFGARPGASIPQASGDWAATKGAYRALNHPEVKVEQILQTHREATLERAREQRVVLAVQDTTTLNFSTHPQTLGLGPVSNNQDKTVGLLLHTTLVLREDGQALGLLEKRLWARDPARFQTRPKGERNRLPVEQKESTKWLHSLEASVQAAQALPDTLWINIADREADSYDLFWRLVELRATPDWGAAAQRVELLIRSQHNRALSGEQERLFGHLASLPVGGQYRCIIPRQPGRKAREATLTLRWARVSLPPPPDQIKHQARSTPLELWAILAEEENPVPGQPPICWRLLSTLPVENAHIAALQVHRYSQRWEIEVFHKTLKSGSKAEERQLENTKRLERCLLLDMITAWRTLALSKAGRGEHAQQPVSPWLTEHQWKALWCHIHQRTDPPETPPTIGQATRWVAQLGGFLGRRGDGHPGVMTLWRGLQRLTDFTRAYLLFANPQKDMGNA